MANSGYWFFNIKRSLDLILWALFVTVIWFVSAIAAFFVLLLLVVAREVTDSLLPNAQILAGVDLTSGSLLLSVSILIFVSLLVVIKLWLEGRIQTWLQFNSP